VERPGKFLQEQKYGISRRKFTKEKKRRTQKTCKHILKPNKFFFLKNKNKSLESSQMKDRVLFS